MIIVNTDFITGKQIETISIVRGTMVQTKNFFVDFGQGIKFLFGGELRAYNRLMESSRVTATERMVAEAKKLKADAIINVRYETSTIMNGSAETIVYGTAVKFIKKTKK